MWQNIKHGIQGHAVDWYSDVFDIVFPNVDAKEVNEKWKGALKEEGKSKKKEKKEKKRKQKDRDEDEDEDEDDDDDD